MKLEDQVISLDLAKKLKELGVKQDSYFYWYYSVYADEDLKWKVMQHHRLNMKAKAGKEGLYSAFTFIELLKCIPRKIHDCDFEIIFIPRLHGNGNVFIDKPEIRYRTAHLQKSDPDYKYLHGVSDRNMNSNINSALAKMLIYLIENNLVKVEDINNAIIS